MNKEQFLIKKFKIDTAKPAPYFIKCSRWKMLPYLLAEIGIKTMVEIGTEQGKYADCLLRKIPGLNLSVVDCWEAYPDYREKMQAKIDWYYQEAKRRLSGRATIIKKYSVEAVNDFEDESLDAVYIDGNHNLESVIEDVALWSKKVKKGGLVMGHDYLMEDAGYEQIEVKAAIDAWTTAKKIKVWFITDEGERCPSWLWVK